MSPCCCGRFPELSETTIINDITHELLGPAGNFCGLTIHHDLRDLQTALTDARWALDKCAPDWLEQHEINDCDECDAEMGETMEEADKAHKPECEVGKVRAQWALVRSDGRGVRVAEYRSPKPRGSGSSPGPSAKSS